MISAWEQEGRPPSRRSQQRYRLRIKMDGGTHRRLCPVSVRRIGERQRRDGRLSIPLEGERRINHQLRQLPKHFASQLQRRIRNRILHSDGQRRDFD